MLLGTWLAPLALIGRGPSWMVRAAMVVLIAALGVFVLWFQPGFHDVRLFQSAEWLQAKDQEDRDFKRQPLIGEVLDEWLQANGCDPAAPSACQRQPIIVAAEGGAARSAFFASTMLGAVMDVARKHPETFADPAQRIFLMSGVSGGSLGIGTFQTALLEAAPGGAPPCRSDQVDWGAGAGTASSDDPARCSVLPAWRPQESLKSFAKVAGGLQFALPEDQQVPALTPKRDFMFGVPLLRASEFWGPVFCV